MVKLKTLTTFGEVRAMNGENLFINTLTDEMITLRIKNKEVRKQLYCSAVKVTIEIISQDELKKHL